MILLSVLFLCKLAGNGGLTNYYFGGNRVLTNSHAYIKNGGTVDYGTRVAVNQAKQLYASNYKDSLLIVGSYRDGKNYGLHAGTHADRYVVDTPTAGVRGYGSATSWVTPKVAGKVALIKSKFKNLNAKQITDIVLETADDIGAPGVDPVFGHGLVNLGRALSPVGNIR